jgi:hypothetical protein
LNNTILKSSRYAHLQRKYLWKVLKHYVNISELKFSANSSNEPLVVRSDGTKTRKRKIVSQNVEYPEWIMDMIEFFTFGEINEYNGFRNEFKTELWKSLDREIKKSKTPYFKANAVKEFARVNFAFVVPENCEETNSGLYIMTSKHLDYYKIGFSMCLEQKVLLCAQYFTF